MNTVAHMELVAIAPGNLVQVDSPSGLSGVIPNVASMICGKYLDNGDMLMNL